VVIDDLDIDRTFSRPDEADAPLVIDADAVLAPSIFLERLKMVSRRDPKILEHRRPVKLRKFAKGRALDVDPAANASPFKQRFGVLALESLD
jgi:hypothetical protein